MTHYDLTSKDILDNAPDNGLSTELLEQAKESFTRAKDNIDRAESVVRNLGLTEFEISVLARRLLNE